jgi:hypothetical protein
MRSRVPQLVWDRGAAKPGACAVRNFGVALVSSPFVRELAPLGYPPAVAIVACPFCREMFDLEEASSCPVCGIPLQSLEKLPPAKTLLHELEDDGIPPAPENIPFPVTFLGRARGPMILLGVIGLALFFAPWIHLTLPYVDDLSGFDLARRGGWSWGAAVAWVVMVPTVASRRTIAQLRGARFAACFLSVIPVVTLSVLMLFPPQRGVVPVRFTYGWPFWATFAVSLIATVVGSRLGGRVEVMDVPTGTSVGQTLH